MSELIAVSPLAEHFSRGVKTIEDALAAAGLKATPINYGKGQMRVYDKDAAMEVLSKAFAPAPAPASDTLTAADARFIHLANQIEDRTAKILRAVEQSGAAIENKVDTALVGASQLAEQNKLMFRAINDMRADLLARLNALQETIDAHAEPPPETAQVVHMAAAKAAKHDPRPQEGQKAAKRRIAVVGLPNGQRQVIEKEFGPIFDVTFFESDNSKGLSFYAGFERCERVFLMSAYAHEGVTTVTKAAGTRLVRITGGMSSLRDKLTALFVEQEEAVHG